MYNKFQLAKKYFYYLLTAQNGRGHGIHSPFVFDFIKNVLRDTTKYKCYTHIENLRQRLKNNLQMIEVQDYGAGSAMIKSNKRSIKSIATSSLKSQKYAQLLHRIIRYYKPATIIELGTSLGITTAYLASGNTSGNVYSCEGADAIAAIAQRNFNELQLHNIKLLKGNFEITLPALLSTLNKVDFAFIDGNHRKEPTVQYFNQLLPYCQNSTILIFDDIHWSKDMEAAWQEIQQHEKVTLSIDLFFIGLIFLSSDFKVKQHFTIRF